MNRVEVLETARAAITRDRAATHGDAENSFQLIADFWTVWLGDRLKGQIAPFDVAQMMVLFKSARARGNPTHMDNLVDQVGYAALSAEMVPGNDRAGQAAAMVLSGGCTCNSCQPDPDACPYD